MNINVTFQETGKQEDYEFEVEPFAGQIVTLVQDGKKTDYFVETVSGPIIDNICRPTMVRVRPTSV